MVVEWLQRAAWKGCTGHQQKQRLTPELKLSSVRRTCPWRRQWGDWWSGVQSKERRGLNITKVGVLFATSVEPPGQYGATVVQLPSPQFSTWARLES